MAWRLFLWNRKCVSMSEVDAVLLCADMAAASCLLTEDQLLCSICLDVFTLPVTTSCGHNFCKSCITQQWDMNVPWTCPLCKRAFPERLELQVNTFINEMVAQYRQRAQQEQQRQAEEGDVPCDLCSGTKMKALKSCLVCLVSYCETHLGPHQTVPGLQRHQLIDPVKDLEGRMCLKHSKALELFCRTDQTYLCSICTASEHKTHEFFPLGKECEQKAAELEEEIHELINDRDIYITAFTNSIDLTRRNADQKVAEGVQVFTSLMETVKRGLEDLVASIEETQEMAQGVLERHITELKEEVSELEKRRTEMQNAPLSGDPLQLLQSLRSTNIQRALRKNWLQVDFHPPFHEGSVVRAVAQLEMMVSQQMKSLVEDDLKRVRHYAVEVTFDPETAHPTLVLSEDGKQVSPGDEKQNLPENPKRFSINPCVLGKQSFSSGRFYFEVQVKGKTEWDCGVASESINRKEDVPLSPEDGYWAIWLRKRVKFKALKDPPVCLCLKSRPSTVGVFVDYQEGVVSFYDVDAPALIYSFTGCSFTKKLHPYFNPGLKDGAKNTAPLVLVPPVDQKVVSPS